MAQVIKYNLCTKINHGTDEKPHIEEILTPVTMGWNEANESIAKAEAYNGEYTIEDDGVEEIYQPTVQEQLDAQAAAILELMGVSVDG